jgi:MarR family transcriptional regulator, 2-MHQ and catechol-resistance regulon repressor
MNQKNHPAAEILAMANQIRLLCSVITKIARADLQAHLESHHSGITSIEHGVLRHLSHGVTSMAEISRRMGVAPSTLVYVVDGLVKRKLVRRGKDPQDRRREPLLLEKKGAALFAAVPEMDSDSSLVQSLHTMKDPHRRQLVDLLSEFAAGLQGAQRINPDSPARSTAKKAPK